jgi:phosphohistidine phosphatase
MVRPMLTLFLLRHAKSSWDDARVKDFDRPLAKRGRDAAPRMGAYMAERELIPELVLCSTAARARQTLELVLPSFSPAPAVLFEDGLYLAAAATLLTRLRKIEGGVGKVMIVGHDPGMHRLAVELSATGDPQELQALTAKFPTGGLAVISFQARDWAKIKPATGRLIGFMAPKRLS